MLVCTPLGTTMLTALHVIVSPLYVLSTLYVKVDINVYVSSSVTWVLSVVEYNVTSVCPFVHWIVAAGRLPVDIQENVTGTVSSVLTGLEMSDVVFGFTELIWYKICIDSELFSEYQNCPLNQYNTQNIQIA